MKRYPKYKESGALWLGQVPVHWPIVRYKYLFREKHTKKESTLQAGAISFGRVVFKDDEMLPPATKASYQEVLKGEYLINPINLNYDLKSLRTALSEIDVCVSPAYIVLRPLMDSDPGYLKYQLHLFDLCHMKTLGAGVRQTISFGDIGVCGTIVPPKEEQVAIASFLDRVVDEMDSAIASQERMIELLKERRSAIITQAVTKGLDPKAKMKDSEVPWLEQVPTHWEVKRGRFMFKVNGGFGAQSQKLECAEVQFLPMEKIGERNDLNLDTTRVVDDKANSYVECLEGDVIVAKVTPCFENGKGAVARGLAGGAALATSEVHTLRPYGAHAEFVYYSTLSGLYRQAGAAEMYGVGGLRRVPPLFFKDARLAMPGAGEQEEIVDHLNASISKMDSAIASQERMIELLKERRSAIITQAVTGQIDVR